MFCPILTLGCALPKGSPCLCRKREEAQICKWLRDIDIHGNLIPVPPYPYLPYVRRSRSPSHSLTNKKGPGGQAPRPKGVGEGTLLGDALKPGRS